MWFKWFLVFWYILATVVTICSIGEEREPISPGLAAATTIFAGLIIAGILYTF